MLEVTIPACEFFDENKNEFITTKQTTLQLEHSLVSISKWESKWNKPFLSKTPMTNEETTDYVRCMTITQNINPIVYSYIPKDIYDQIGNYIEAPMTATWFAKDEKKGGSKETVTSELIYYWMISLQIPFECQKWHLNRLLTLIRVCNVKNAPSKKMSNREILDRNRALNEARRKKYNSKG